MSRNQYTVFDFDDNAIHAFEAADVGSDGHGWLTVRDEPGGIAFPLCAPGDWHSCHQIDPETEEPVADKGFAGIAAHDVDGMAGSMLVAVVEHGGVHIRGMGFDGFDASDDDGTLAITSDDAAGASTTLSIYGPAAWHSAFVSESEIVIANDKFPASTPGQTRAEAEAMLRGAAKCGLDAGDDCHPPQYEAEAADARAAQQSLKRQVPAERLVDPLSAHVLVGRAEGEESRRVARAHELTAEAANTALRVYGAFRAGPDLESDPGFLGAAEAAAQSHMNAWFVDHCRNVYGAQGDDRDRARLASGAAARGLEKIPPTIVARMGAEDRVSKNVMGRLMDQSNDYSDRVGGADGRGVDCVREESDALRVFDGGVLLEVASRAVTDPRERSVLRKASERALDGARDPATAVATAEKLSEVAGVFAPAGDGHESPTDRAAARFAEAARVTSSAIQRDLARQAETATRPRGAGSRRDKQAEL